MIALGLIGVLAVGCILLAPFMQAWDYYSGVKMRKMIRKCRAEIGE